MHSTLHTWHRAALLAALLGGFAVAVPRTAEAQSGTATRALLNRLDPTPRGGEAVFTDTQVRAVRTSGEEALHGERALLNTFRTAERQQGGQAQAFQRSPSVVPFANGLKALLNRSSW